jgi:hypothetical protein
MTGARSRNGKEKEMTVPTPPVDPKAPEVDPEVDPVDPAPDDKAPELGDAGKRAIDAMKRERNLARKELADALKKNKEYDDKDKTEAQRLAEAAEESKTRATKAETGFRKLQTALDRAPDGTSQATIRAVAKRLSGETDEEIEADADELFALLAPTVKPPAGKPTEKLSGGSDPADEPDEKDPRRLADLIGRH